MDVRALALAFVGSLLVCCGRDRSAPPPAPASPIPVPVAGSSVGDDAAVPTREPKAEDEPVHVVGMFAQGKLFAECQDPDVDFVSCARTASKNNPDAPGADAMLPIACYRPRTKKWSTDVDCIQRRGLRLSKQSDPNRVRPLVLACYGKAVGVELQEGEYRSNTVMVAPFDANLHFQELSAQEGKPPAELKKWITKSRAAGPVVYVGAIQWSTLTMNSYDVELDGDGKIDQLIFAKVDMSPDKKHEYNAVLLATDKKTPLEFTSLESRTNYGTSLGASMDLDSDGRYEVAELHWDEGVMVNLLTLVGSEMKELGSENCWP